MTEPISDNGAQYTAGEFKKFIKRTGLTHVRTSPYYPQSNGKIERFHYTFKSQCVQRNSFLNLEDAQALTQKYIDHYNKVRLHSAIKFVTPFDVLEGRASAIINDRKRKMKEAKEKRKKEFVKKVS